MALGKTAAPAQDDPFFYIYQDLVALEDSQQGSGGGGSGGSGGGNNLGSGVLKGMKLGGKDSLGNNPKEYSSIGPKQGSVLPAGDQGNGATTTPVKFDDAGIETTTYDGAGNQIGDTTTSQGTGGESSGDSGGSWMGAIVGGISGYKAGKKNYETDPDMTSGEDGYGKYHHDARAEVGGGIGGAWLGYEGGAAISGPAVEWSHPYMQDMTRSVINAGDDAGGAYGAMVADPIGTMASGKYSWEQIKDSGDMFSSDEGTMGGEAVKFGDKVGGTYGSFMMNPIATVKSDDFEWKNLFKLFNEGGAVDGPGSKTSDSIPARLSDGEYVLNAEAVELFGEENLDKLNAAGLQRRGHTSRTKRGHYANGGAMSRGGWNSFNQGLQSGYTIGEKYQQAKEREELQRIMADNGSTNQASYDNYNQSLTDQDRATFGADAPAVDGTGKQVSGYTYNSQSMAERPSDAKLNTLKMNRIADYYASKGQTEKALQMRGQAMQLEEASYQQEQRARERSFVAKWKDRMDRADKDPAGVLKEIHPEYQANKGPYADGHQIFFSSTPDGEVATRVNMETGQVTGSQLLTPELAKQALVRAYQMERAHLSLDQNDKVFDRDMKEGALGVQRQQASTMEGYRRDQAETARLNANRPHFAQDGSGQVLELGPQGGLRGTYGSPRPLAGGAGGREQRPSEMTVAERVAMNEAVNARAQEDAADAGKSWKKLDAGQKEMYRQQAAAALGFDVSPRVKGIQGQPTEGGGAVPLVVPKEYGAPQGAAKPTEQIPGDPAQATPSRGLQEDASFADRRAAALAAIQRAEAIKVSPAYRELEAQRRAALRANNPTAANAIMVKQRNLLSSE